LARAGCSGNAERPLLLLLLLLLAAAAEVNAKLAPHEFVQGCVEASRRGSDRPLGTNGLQQHTGANGLLKT
jgi:hypothetical protein